MSATKTLLAASVPQLQAHFWQQPGEMRAVGAVASGRECAAFRLWIDDLPAEGYDALMQLRGCGFAYDLDGLSSQLARALHVGPAGPLARIVGQRVLNLLAAHADAVCFFLEEGD